VTQAFKDLEEATLKANIKFTSAAIASAAVSWFDLSNDPKLVAFAFENVSERSVEIGLFIIAIALLCNYALRVFDERKVLSKMQIEMNDYKDKLKIISTNVSIELENSQSYLISLEDKIASIDATTDNKSKLLDAVTRLQKIDDKQSKQYRDLKISIPYLEDDISDSLKMARHSLKKNFQLGEGLSKVLVQAEKNLAEAKVFQTRLRDEKIFLGATKARIILFNYLAPLILLGFMVSAFLFGVSTDPIPHT